LFHKTRQINLQETMKYTALIFLLFSLFQFSSCVEDKEELKPVITNNPLTSEQDKLVDQIINPLAAKSATIGLSIGILKDGVFYQYGYGEMVKGSGDIPDNHTLFEIGSITKTFTAALLVNKLNALGLDANQPIGQFLPSDIPALTKDDQEILVKHLLTHTSGLPRLPGNFEDGMDINNPYKHYDSTKVYNYLKAYALTSKPGSSFEYSNLGIGVAGLIVERITGKSYEQNLIETICDPLEMDETRITVSSSSNFAKGYDSEGNEAQYWDDLGGFKGAGAIRSNVHDMLIYAQSQLEESNTPLRNTFQTCQQVYYQASPLKLGLTWFYLPISNQECLLHDGGTGGFRSFLYISKSQKMALIVLCNNADDDFAVTSNNLAAELFK
jgi:CubicO group peptidase (beta-lactamase class C family)